ncbi:hypothetical protein AABB24_016014 [Solanum stoloniferum]|uniref:Uncharacterized protein n=2 Tax=Solanum TaxID=4107 RepID=A0AAF0UJJ5_SOLVR|nr:uncharacterized protein LOC125811153 [Solanum verrucosum]WMV47392.1 hypothetical protein MTR67_040777 [Solanum verrucosum]
MYCLNLRRVLLPTRKMWKFFSTKLQINFHKVLNRSKVIKKSKNPNPLCIKKLAPSPAFRVQFKTKRSNNKFKYKSKFRPTLKFQKKSAPVYIDQLFIENISDSVVKNNFGQTSMITTKKKEHKQVCITETEQDEIIHEGESSSSSSVTNDELWESLTLASPQLHCINERAEEFIAKFRADMLRQENMLIQRL